MSTFAFSDLNDRLQGAGIDTVALFGVATNISVECTGTSVGGLGYRDVIVEDTFAAASQEGPRCRRGARRDHPGPR